MGLLEQYMNVIAVNAPKDTPEFKVLEMIMNEPTPFLDVYSRVYDECVRRYGMGIKITSMSVDASGSFHVDVDVPTAADYVDMSIRLDECYVERADE